MLINDIISGYLIKNLVKIFSITLIIIIIIIFGDMLVPIINYSAENNSNIQDIMLLMAVKILTDAPLILLLTIFLSCIVAMGKLYKESEIIILNAVGISEVKLFTKILPLTITIAIIITIISLLTPSIKAIESQLLIKNANTFQIDIIKSGEFLKLYNKQAVLYANKENKYLKNIFLYTTLNDNKIILLAQNSEKYKDNNGNIYLRLKNGVRYQNLLSNDEKNIMNFVNYDIKITNHKQPNIVKDNHNNVIKLMQSSNLNDIALWQWRISIPISLFVLIFLAILFAKNSPRSNKNFGILWGTLTFIAYIDLLQISMSAIKDAKINPIIGLWWVHILFICLAACIYAYRHNKLKNIITRLQNIISIR